MPLAHFSKVGGSGIWTPDLLRGRPERIPLHHQPMEDKTFATIMQDEVCIMFQMQKLYPHIIIPQKITVHIRSETCPQFDSFVSHQIPFVMLMKSKEGLFKWIKYGILQESKNVFSTTGHKRLQTRKIFLWIKINSFPSTLVNDRFTETETENPTNQPLLTSHYAIFWIF